MAEFVPAKVPPVNESREPGMDHAHYPFRALPDAPRFVWHDGGRPEAPEQRPSLQCATRQHGQRARDRDGILSAKRRTWDDVNVVCGKLEMRGTVIGCKVD